MTLKRRIRAASAVAALAAAFITASALAASPAYADAPMANPTHTVTSADGGAESLVQVGGGPYLRFQVCDVKADGHHPEGELLKYDPVSLNWVPVSQLSWTGGSGSGNNCSAITDRLLTGTGLYRISATNYEGTKVVGATVRLDFNV